MPVAHLDGLDLHWEERGSGPTLLLIAGIPAVASDWEPVAVRMAAAGRRAIAFDNRGSGASSVTPGPYTTAGLAADAVALLDHLAVERADVFGMSLGGMIAQELAIGWPSRVRRLVLGCTHAGRAHAPRPPRETGLAFTIADWADRIRALAPLAFASSADPALAEALIAAKADDPQDPAGYAGQIAAALDHDALDRLASIRAPTLVLTGDDDRVIPGASSDVLVERIPDARLELVEGAGHLFFLERPDETERLLVEFLAD